MDWSQLNPQVLTEWREARLLEDTGRPADEDFTFNLDLFAGAISEKVEEVDLDRSELLRKVEIHTDDLLSPTAGFVVRYGLTGAPPSLPDDPSALLDNWRELTYRATEFYQDYQSRNDLGAVFWRRFSQGGRICVIADQRFDAQIPAYPRHLAAYFCREPGGSLTDGQAETVVQSIVQTAP